MWRWVQKQFAALRTMLMRATQASMRWWKRCDKRYGLWWRIGNCFVALVILISTLIPLYNLVSYHLWYALDEPTKKLVGTTDSKLTSKLSYNADTRAYEFNKSALKDNFTNPYASLQAQIGHNTTDSLYALDVHEDGNKGVTYHDVNSGLDFTITPQFTVSGGQEVDGHLVFPVGGGNKIVYTLKNNGLKEDIVVPHAQDEMTFSYTLNLPKTLEARIIPHSGGQLGIYSANPSLFADISYSSDKDRQAVEKARETGEKNYLVFGLPAPVAVDTNGKTVGNSHFSLDGTTLKITASGLGNAKTPIAIDPSVVVTSTSDFQVNGNNDGNISFATSGRVERGLIGGGTDTWSATTSLPSGNTAPATATYNNYMYTIGGTGFGSNVYYAAINSNGTVGSWTATSSMNTARSYTGATAYNGYLYVWGGYNTSSNVATASVEYAPINSDGTLGSWQTTTSMSTAVCRAATASYKGYLYSFGGSTSPSSGCTTTSTGATSTVQYAPLKADGTVGTWQTTTSIAYGTSGQVMGAMAAAYNGYMYLMGGHNNNAGTSYSNVQSAPINSDGTLGSWTATTSLSAATYTAGITVYNGYLYVFSNQSSSQTSYYAPIYTSGVVGNWFADTSGTGKLLTAGRWGGSATSYNNYVYYVGGSGPSTVVDYASLLPAMDIESNNGVTTSFTTSRERAASVSYNGCLYLVGGYGGSSNRYVNYVQYAPVDTLGNITTAWGLAQFTTSRADLAAVAYDGYLYVIGGYNSTTYYNTVQYAAINSDCSLESFATTTAFDSAGNARGGMTSFAYNGYMYVAGGINGSGNFSAVRYAPINSDGTIGTWNATTSLPSTMNRQRTAIWGNKVYLLGGTQVALPDANNGATTGSRPTGSGSSSTYYATINNDGTLGSWTSTTSLPYDLYEFGAVATGGYMFIVGGFTSSSGTYIASGANRAWYVAPINSDGTLGSWTIVYDRGSGYQVGSAPLTTVNGYLFVIGGRSDTGITNTNRLSGTNRAPLIDGGGGATTTWASSSSLVAGRSYAGSAASGGYMYVAGGSSDGGSTGRTDIEYSQIGNNGALGGWSTDGHSLSSGRMFPGVVAYRGHLYVVGGKTSSSYYGNVQYTDIVASTGALGSNFTTSSTFVTGTGSDTGRSGVCAVAYGDYLYSIGGYDGTSYYNTVRSSPINSTTGALGSWSDSGSNFTNARYGSSCFAANGYLYVLGGRNGSTNYKDVQVAAINGDGTLGTWAYTANFTGARAHFVAGYNNGFVYIYGGCTSTACSAGYSDVQYAQVGLDGKLSNWQYRSTTNTSATPYLTTGTVYNGYIYQLGGSASSSTTTYAPLLVTPRTGTYSKFIDLGGMSKISSITYNGKLSNGNTPGISPVSFSSAKANGEFFSSTLSTNVNSSGAPCDTTNPAFTRYIRIDVTLDNTTSSAFADTSDLQSYLSDFTINYSPVHPSPDMRLRGGKTLQDGNLSALDTCYP
ncbi:MAG: hypothetical protein WBO49_02810 [Candidatus Saccharimonas sp.]